MTTMDMKQWYVSMENAIKLQGRARAQKRARQAENEQKEFKEKLMRAANSQVESDGRILNYDTIYHKCTTNNF